MIQLENVSKHYAGTQVVAPLSLTVAAGEVLVLLGASGSGKTTTLKMINRLIEPTAGRVVLSGQDVTAIPVVELRRQIGYVFQRVGLFPHLTVAENIGITPLLLRWDPERIRQRVAELLALVELDAALSARLPHELSGGQAQRVGVARALAASPRVMLLDEPFGALDALTRDRLQQTFLRIKTDLGMTAVFVTHDIVEALRIGDRIAVMRGGRVLQIGTRQEILHAPADPYVADLLQTPRRQLDELQALLASDVEASA